MRVVGTAGCLPFLPRVLRFVGLPDQAGPRQAAPLQDRCPVGPVGMGWCPDDLFPCPHSGKTSIQVARVGRNNGLSSDFTGYSGRWSWYTFFWAPTLLHTASVVCSCSTSPPERGKSVERGFIVCRFSSVRRQNK